MLLYVLSYAARRRPSHAQYNQGDDDERRGDGYMSAFSKTVANVPWMPIVSITPSHEYYEPNNLGNYRRLVIMSITRARS